jgi:hypothetical protein
MNGQIGLLINVHALVKQQRALRAPFRRLHAHRATTRSHVWSWLVLYAGEVWSHLTIE